MVINSIWTAPDTFSSFANVPEGPFGAHYSLHVNGWVELTDVKNEVKKQLTHRFDV